MSHIVKYLTAESEAGREAIIEVMGLSFQDEISDHLKEWSIARIVDGTPVSFILIDPYKQMDFRGGKIRYAFIGDVATRKDRRSEGHFRGIMEHAFGKISENGITIVGIHGHSKLYRDRFGFNTFTYNQGIFATPEEIEMTLGVLNNSKQSESFEVLSGKFIHDDLLIVTDIKVMTINECKNVLQQAASIAKELGKNEILFEYPFSESTEAFYPAYKSIDFQLCRIAEVCGARRVLQGAFPESGPVSHGDWIMLLKPYELVKSIIELADDCSGVPSVGVNMAVDGSTLSINSTSGGIRVSPELLDDSEADNMQCTTTDLVRLVTGYHSISELDSIRNLKISEIGLSFLDTLFPKTWRFSRNENWTYKQ
jgi:hypothetical protein